MEIFKGPLGSHLNYLSFIVLENCNDYFLLLKQQQEKKQNKTPDNFKRLRYFLNAIESLNNIPEYIFHEFKDEKKWNDKQLSNIVGKIRNNFLILKDITQIANAYKHCIRKNKSNLSAPDLQASIFKIKLESKKIDIEFNFNSIESEDILGEAFRFWIKYKNNPNVDYLLNEK